MQTCFRAPRNAQGLQLTYACPQNMQKRPIPAGRGCRGKEGSPRERPRFTSYPLTGATGQRLLLPPCTLLPLQPCAHTQALLRVLASLCGSAHLPTLPSSKVCAALLRALALPAMA